MELFDKKFVHFMWDDELRGKECFYNDDIEGLQQSVNDNNADFKGVLEPNSSAYPFRPVFRGKACCSWRFAYYDPNYECKVAYNEGKQIQYREKGKGVWCDGTPAWDPRYEYRIKQVTYYVGMGIGTTKTLTWDFAPTSYKHVYASFGNLQDANKWISEHRKFVPVMRAFEKGIPIEYKVKGGDWTETSTPSWDLRLRYRVKPTHTKKALHSACFMTSKKRRMTNRELAKWLAEGRGQKATINGNAITYHTYKSDEDEKPAHDCMVRAWNETEWHVPEVENDSTDN